MPCTPPRTGRRGAVALGATGLLLVAAPVGPASAAVTAGTYEGSTFAQGVAVDLTPPGAEEPAFSLALLQAKGTSVADRSGDTVTPRSALAFAGVVGGTPQTQTPAQLAELDGALATLEAPGPVTTSQEAPENPLLALAADFSAAVVPATADSTSAGDVASFATTPLGDIAELEPLTGPVRSGLTTLLDALAAPLEMSVGADGLGAVLGALAPVTGQLPPPVAEAFPGLESQITGQLAALVAELDELDALLFDTPLLSIDDVVQTQTVIQEAGGVRSVAETTVGSIDVLGGLLSVAGPDTRAETFVTGAQGGGTADATATRTLEAELLEGVDLLGLIIGGPEAPVDLTVLGGVTAPVTDPLVTAIADLQTALEEGLGQAGLRIEPGAEEEEVSEDGRTARAGASGVLVSLTPPGGAEEAEPLLRLAVGDSLAASRATPTPPAPVAPPAAVAPVAAVQQLPRTGADSAVLGLTGLALLTGAAVLRRRRTGSPVLPD